MSKQFYYALVASGVLAAFPSSQGKTLSSKLFKSRECAKAYMPEFRKQVTERRENSISDLADNDNLKILIIEMEVSDGQS